MKKPPASTQSQTIPRALRRYLYFTASITGAAILIVEILGAKMLAPYVGTSHFVWTAQIAVTLVALAVGYYFGGWLVGRSTRLGRLYVCILLAAIYLGVTILVREPIAYACLEFRLALGALLTSALLFFVPLTLLATTGPFLIRVLTQSVNSVGEQVGRLFAISTLGSVAGTVLIGYLLIPFFPNSVTMFVTSALLMLVAAGYFFIWGRKERLQVSAAIGMIIGILFGLGGIRIDSLPKESAIQELYRANSNFGLLQVFDRKDGNRRFYLNDYLVQNTYDPAEKQSLALFTYMLHGLSRAYTKQINDVLCIGLGVGIVPMQFAREGARVDVAEINPAVVPMAVKYFDLQPEKLKIAFGDGRYYLNRTTNRYDTIILDAFLGDSSPSHLMTREAFASMRRILRPDGTVVINCFGELQTGQDFFIASLDKTLKAVFQNVRIHSAGTGNVFFVATDQAEFKPPSPPDPAQIHPSVREVVTSAFSGVIQANPAHGRVLRDDFNPVEYYDAANREYIRRQLALSMRPM